MKTSKALSAVDIVSEDEAIDLSAVDIVSEDGAIFPEDEAISHRRWRFASARVMY